MRKKDHVWIKQPGSIFKKIKESVLDYSYKGDFVCLFVIVLNSSL